MTYRKIALLVGAMFLGGVLVIANGVYQIRKQERAASKCGYQLPTLVPGKAMAATIDATGDICQVSR